MVSCSRFIWITNSRDQQEGLNCESIVYEVVLLKIFFMKLIFEDEGYLYDSCLFYILNIYGKCLLFQFLSHGIRMHISILTGVQNVRIIS